LLLNDTDLSQNYGACGVEIKIERAGVDVEAKMHHCKDKKAEVLKKKFLDDMDITKEFFSTANNLLDNQKLYLLEEIKNSTAEFQSNMIYQKKALEKTGCYTLFSLNKKQIEDEFLRIRRPLLEAFSSVEREKEELERDFQRDVRRLKFIFSQMRK